MLTIEIPGQELYDNTTGLFSALKTETLQLEHSLVSLSKWESKWCIPFLGKNQKTDEQIIDYIRCMTISQNVKPEVYQRFSGPLYKQIQEYIDAPMTATWFSDKQGPAGGNGEIVTAELIYYWMVALQIPFECQKWHLNRLLTLIRVCNIKNQKPQKPGRREALSSRAALNAARRAKYNTRG